MRLRTNTLPLLLAVLHLLPGVTLANAAAPGIWDAGHGATLIPVFRAEAPAIAQIQMQRELVLVDLYRNFAVVKGTYWFFNHGASTHRIHVGYPINGKVAAVGREHVTFKDLYHLRVRVAESLVPVHRLSRHPDSVLARPGVDNVDAIRDEDDWYVWTMEFPAGKPVQVEVYFIVHTPASLTEGYGRREANAFEYILHTGSAWKDSIMSGQLVVTLKDGLGIEDIRGVYPIKKTLHGGNQILYTFTSLRPSVEDDLVVWYEGSREHPAGDMKAEVLFDALDRTDLGILERKDLKVMDKSDFTTPAPGWAWAFWGVLIAGVLFWVALFYGLYRLVGHIRKRSRQRNV
jgi:hypothetical protein